MKDILKLEKCPVSGLQITTKPEWKYKADDGSCSIELAVIGDNILYKILIGVLDGEANKWYIKTADKIIVEYFGDRKYYLGIDYSLLNSTSLEARKLFINWVSLNFDKVELVVVFGMNNIMKVVVKTAIHITKKYERLRLTNSYKELIKAILQNEKSTIKGNGVLFNRKCPISDLPITTNPEWRYEKKDYSYSVEIGKIGDNILYVYAAGFSTVENNLWFIEHINKLIDENYKLRPISIIFDHTNLGSASLQSRKTFVNWANSIMFKVQAILFFGINNKLKFTIFSAKKISSKYDTVLVVDSYNDAIKTLVKSDGKCLNKEQAKNTRINELIGYLGKMTWTGNLDQKIPVLPSNDPLAELFAAVATNQEDLREIEKERNEAHERIQIEKAKINKLNSQLTATINALPDLMFEVDSEGRIFSYHSPSDSHKHKQELLYANPDVFLNKRIDEVLPKDAAIICNNAIKEAIETGKHTGATYSLQFPNGVFWFELSIATKSNSEISEKRVIMLVRDITKRKKAEDILRLSNRVLEASTNHISVIGKDFNYKYVNNAYTNAHGLLANNIIGTHISELLGKQIFEVKIKPLLIKCIAGEEIKYESWFTFKNLGQRFMVVEYLPLFAENGNVESVVVVSKDITERKKTEEIIKASEEKYQLLTETMKDVVVKISITGELLYVSPAIEHFGGHKPEEVIGNNMVDFFAEEKDYQRAVELITEVIETHKSGNFEFMYKSKNKIPFPVEHTYVPLLRNNKVYAIQLVMRDITERKEAEEALKESNKTKDKFFSIIAHDLKSPFNSLLGYSEILNNDYHNYSSKEKKSFIGIIHEGLQNTLKLLDDLLLWAWTQKGTIAYHPKKINLYSIVKETSELLSQSIEKKSIQLINRITDNIYVEADKDMLATIIRNLLSNALKFTNKHGKITISADIQEEKHNKFVTIKVNDTGVGIAKELQKTLFDIGENISTKGTENEKGTGLGLILCKEFVDIHGGEIWVESEEGKGSSFFFSIPYIS